MENERPRVALDFLGLDRSSCEARNEHDRAEASIMLTPALPSFPSLESRSLPSVAMSLRTRENSALALKHIFDRINASSENPSLEGNTCEGGKDASIDEAGCSPESSSSKLSNELGDCVRPARSDFRSNDMPQDTHSFLNHNGSRRSGRSLQVAADMKASSAVLTFSQQGPSLDKNSVLGSRKSATENERAIDAKISKKKFTDFDLPFGEAQVQDPAGFLSQRKLFCSHMSVNSVAHEGRIPSLRQERQLESSWMTHRTNATEKHQRAQLTIFYSGMVNVYDDVPADKAHAIMLLASSSIHSSTKPCFPVDNIEPTLNRASFLSSSEPVKPANSSISVGGFASRPSTAAAPMTNNNLLISSLSSPTPTLSFNSTQALSLPFVSAELKDNSPVASEMLKQLHPHLVASAARKISQAELPFARKASLARFLEKRKDMVQAKARQNLKDQKEMIHPETPSASKKQCVRSSSPSFGCFSSLPGQKI